MDFLFHLNADLLKYKRFKVFYKIFDLWVEDLKSQNEAFYHLNAYLLRYRSFNFFSQKYRFFFLQKISALDIKSFFHLRAYLLKYERINFYYKNIDIWWKISDL